MPTAAMESGAARTGRAAPLPPDERRRAILRDVRLVVLARGAAVTTRELAQAAGVSEGTLFRVFPDKTTLLRETVHAAVDPAAIIPALDAIDRSAPIADRLARILEIGFERVEETMRWVGVLHELGRLDAAGDPLERRRAVHEEWARDQESGQAEVRLAVARVLRPDSAAFGRPLEQVVALLDLVLVGAAMQRVDSRRRGTTPDVPDVDVLVDHFLHGVLAPSPTRSPS